MCHIFVQNVFIELTEVLYAASELSGYLIENKHALNALLYELMRIFFSETAFNWMM